MFTLFLISVCPLVFFQISGKAVQQSCAWAFLTTSPPTLLPREGPQDLEKTWKNQVNLAPIRYLSQSVHTFGTPAQNYLEENWTKAVRCELCELRISDEMLTVFDWNRGQLWRTCTSGRILDYCVNNFGRYKTQEEAGFPHCSHNIWGLGSFKCKEIL